MRNSKCAAIALVTLVLLAASASTFGCGGPCPGWTSTSGQFPVTAYTTTFCLIGKNCGEETWWYVYIYSGSKPVNGPLFDTFACVCGTASFGETSVTCGFSSDPNQPGQWHVDPGEQVHYHLIRLEICRVATKKWQSGEDVCYSDYVGGPDGDCTGPQSCPIPIFEQAVCP